MARVFITVLAVSIAMVAVMAIPYPQELETSPAPAAETTASPDAESTTAASTASSTAAPGSNNMGFDCAQYNQQCTNNNNQITQQQNNNPMVNNTAGGAVFVPPTQPPQADFCNQAGIAQACQQINMDQFSQMGPNNTQFNVNQTNINNMTPPMPGFNQTMPNLQPPQAPSMQPPQAPSMQPPAFQPPQPPQPPSMQPPAFQPPAFTPPDFTG